jgi:Domain of unknown function (DUF6089)
MRKQHNLILLFFFFPFLSHSQTFSLGGIFGIAGYLGDVNEKIYFRIQRDRTVAGGYFRYQANNMFSLRFNIYKGSLSGSDFDYSKNTWRQQRGFSFVSTFKEYSAAAEYDVLKLLPNTQKLPLSVRLNLGVGYTVTNPIVDYNEPNAIYEDVTADKLAEYNRNILVLPIGLSFEWHFSKTFSLGIDGGMRKTFTDYLDGVSKLGNTKLKDWYFIGGISLTQKLNWIFDDNPHNRRSNRRVKCPSF